MKKMLKRIKYIAIWEELSSEKAMVFLSGPRQSGKTTLSKQIAKNFNNNVYFNWDFLTDKKRLLKNPYFFEDINRIDNTTPLIIYDEIHKYRQWKNYLKGVYDQFLEDYKFLISGSGRLDIRVKAGDSLAGRYFPFHLFPFTIAELGVHNRAFDKFIENPIHGFDINQKIQDKKIWQALFEIGGFPEPFVNGKRTFWEKWSANYIKQVITEDIKNFHDIKNVQDMELLFTLLPEKVGAPLSLNSLARQLQVSFGSVRDWLKLFEYFYLIFRISPWTKKVSRAILKEKKLYIYNYPEIEKEGFRFENMVAMELFRAIYNWNEQGRGRFALHYVRNKEKEEVDFLIANHNKPILLIEVKAADSTPSKILLNFQNIFNVPAVQLVNKPGIFKYIRNGNNRMLVSTASAWLSSLPF